MTVIAARATPTHVIMGCDTAADCAGTSVYLTAGKIGVFSTDTGEKVLLGAAGNAGIVPVLQRNLTITDTPDGVDDEKRVDMWAGAVAEAITEILANATPPLTCGDSPTTLDGTLLMAWRQHLWMVHTHNAFRSPTGVLAIGSGGDIALGSLHTEVGRGPSVAVDVAVRLACRFDTGCGIDDRGPMLYSTLPAYAHAQAAP